MNSDLKLQISSIKTHDSNEELLKLIIIGLNIINFPILPGILDLAVLPKAANRVKKIRI